MRRASDIAGAGLFGWLSRMASTTAGVSHAKVPVMFDTARLEIAIDVDLSCRIGASSIPTDGPPLEVTTATRPTLSSPASRRPTLVSGVGANPKKPSA